MLLLACLFVLLLDELPEDHHAGLLALLDLAAFLLALLEGDILTGTAQKHLIQQGIRLSGCVADAVSRGDPRLFPRDDAVFHFGDNAGGDFSVNIHSLCSFSLVGSKELW